MLCAPVLFPASCSRGEELGDRAGGVTGCAWKVLPRKDGAWDLMVAYEFLSRGEGRGDVEKQDQP